MAVVGRTCVGDFCHVPVTIEGVSCSALVDTGSTVTLVRPDIISDCTELETTTVQLRTVTGELAPMKGKSLLSINVGGKTVRHPVWVAAVQDPCILGLDFLRCTGCQLDLDRGTLSFQGGPTVVMAPSKTTSSVSLPTQSPAWAAMSAEAQSPPVLGLQSAAPLTDLSITSHTPASTSPSPTRSRARLPRTGDETRLSVVREIWQKNLDGLDPDQGELLWQLLLEFKDSFALSEDEVGQTHLVEHHIDTGDARPIKMRPRRLPLARQQAADKALGEMQRAGIIEPSESPWAAAVVMVAKALENWRFCVDYRPLNEVTKKDAYPLPRIDEAMDVVSGSSWFSSLDLRSGYWQVPLAAEARPKTAFYAGGGVCGNSGSCHLASAMPPPPLKGSWTGC